MTNYVQFTSARVVVILAVVEFFVRVHVAAYIYKVHLYFLLVILQKNEKQNVCFSHMNRVYVCCFCAHIVVFEI